MKKNWTIIDDDESFHFTTGLMLSQEEVVNELSSFYNGKEAIEYIHQHLNNPELLPDVILLDLYMPVLDGWDFLTLLDKIEEKLPKPLYIYVVTSSVDDDDYKQLRKIDRVKNYYVKPVNRYMVREILSDQVAA